MSDTHERFDLLLQEKLDELDTAAEQEALLATDEVEQLRLRAAHLVTHTEGRPWPTGAPVRFQQDPAVQIMAPPTLDIRYPARSPLPATSAPTVETQVGRQGRRVP
jgi:hypothetical protein